MTMSSLFYLLGIIAHFAFLLWLGKKYDVSKLKCIIISMAGIVIYVTLTKFLGWAETGFQSFGAENAIRSYMFFPLLMYIVAMFTKVDKYKIFDMVAVVSVLMYGVVHFGCIFAGCCHGFHYKEGTELYNLAMKLTGTDMLPVQFVESVAGLLVFALLMIIAVKKKYDTRGYLLCTWMITFGAMRIVTEFFRDNNKVIKFAPLEQADGFFGISTLAIWATLMMVEGIILLLVFRKKEKSR